jgi:hypothetical protein
MTAEGKRESERARLASLQPEGKANARELEGLARIEALQFIGEGIDRVAYFWLQGQPRWQMPCYVARVADRDIADMLDVTEKGDRLKVVTVFSLNSLRWRRVVWDETVVKVRHPPFVAAGMPDADGIWVW